MAKLPGLLGVAGNVIEGAGAAIGGIASGIGSAVGGIAKGAGSALGGIASGIGSAVGGIAKGAGSALGGALQGALTEPDVVINNFGIAGSAAKSKVKTTVAINFNPTEVKRIDYSEKMPLEKLMVVAIKYLENVSKSIKQQAEQEAKLSRKQALLDKENLIENNSKVEQLDTISGSKDKKDKSSNISTLLKGMGAAAAAILAGNYLLDTSALDKLTKNFELFKKKYGWLFEYSNAIGLGLRLLSFKPVRKLVWQIVKRAGGAVGRTGAAAVTAAGGAITVGAAATFGGAAAVTAIAPFAINSMGKKAIKKAKNVGEKLKEFGIDTKTTKTPGLLGSSFGSFAVNEYSKNGKKLKGIDQKIAQEYAAAYSGERGALSVEELDKKYSDKLLKPTAASQSGNVEKAMNFFQSRGYTKNQAAGIVGNLLVESPGLNPHKPGDGGRAYGIAQWHPDRQAKFKARYGIDIRESNLDQQLDFVDFELKNHEKAAYNDLIRTSDAASAAASIDAKYERSSGVHRNKRVMTAVALSQGDYSSSNIGNSNHNTNTGSSNQSDTTTATNLITESFDNIIHAVKKIGATETTFRKNVTIPAAKFNKTNKLIEDSVKFQNEIDLGKKEDSKKNKFINDTNTTKALRKINGGVLDVIDPNYKMDKNNILTSYIISFKESIA